MTIKLFNLEIDHSIARSSGRLITLYDFTIQGIKYRISLCCDAIDEKERYYSYSFMDNAPWINLYVTVPQSWANVTTYENEILDRVIYESSLFSDVIGNEVTYCEYVNDDYSYVQVGFDYQHVYHSNQNVDLLRVLSDALTISEHISKTYINPIKSIEL